MARKPIKREPTHKPQKEKSSWGHIAIVACQNMLIWSSVYVVASTAYLMCVGAITQEDVLPSAVLLLLASATTIATLALLACTARLHTRTMGENTLKSLSRAETWTKTFLRLTITIWMAACGLTITFTAAKQPFCRPSDGMKRPSINEGSVCVLQRAGIAASLLAMILAGALFILIVKTQDPFRCHAFGIIRERKLLPFALPYTTKDKAMVSEMSFKCRSSSSPSSHTLVGSAEASANTLYGLYPTRPEKAYGLGIYAPQNVQRSTAPSFLTPRPSLSTIRSNIPIGSVPPRSPLPPLPAYFPEKYRKTSATHKAAHPARKARQPSSRREMKRGPRAVPPSPVSSVANVAAFTRSSESPSSTYSRSISGQYHHPLPAVPNSKDESEHSSSSGSTATVQCSPLATTRAATDCGRNIRVNGLSGSCSERSCTEIDDAATLQARLPRADGSVTSLARQDMDPKYLNATHSGLSHHHLYSPSNALAEFEKRKWAPGRKA